MKAKDIKTDGTAYAYQYGTWSEGRKVKVIGPTTVPGARYYSSLQPGWEIEFLDDPPNGAKSSRFGSRGKATSRQIISEWEPFERKAAADRAKEKIRLADQLAADRADRAALLQLRTILANAGYSEAWLQENLHRYSNQFTATELLNLIQDVLRTTTKEN